jgi:lipid-A-disaccharide synthase
MLCLFPFEPELYEKRRCAGELRRSSLCRRACRSTPTAGQRAKSLEIPQARPVIAMLPGSRQSEVRNLADGLHRNRTPSCSSAIRQGAASWCRSPRARRARSSRRRCTHDAGGDDLPIRIMFGHATDAMAASDVPCWSPVARRRLEAALLKRPMVVAYKVAPTSAFLFRHMSYLPYVSLPNILSGRFVVPEFLQEDCTSDNLAQALGNLVCDKETCARLARLFTDMHLELRQDTAERAAQAILPIATRRSAALAVPLEGGAPA